MFTSTIDIKKSISNVLKGGDILLVVPPFASSMSPVMAPHILAKIGEQKGLKVEIIYLNLLIASIIGWQYAEELTYDRKFHTWDMIPERLFVRSAYNLPPLGFQAEQHDNYKESTGTADNQVLGTEKKHRTFSMKELITLEKICTDFIEETAGVLSNLNYKIIGFTLHMRQTNASIGIINRLKNTTPDLITLIGGISCRNEMAEGIGSLSHSIDYIFSGEGEESFSRFLDSWKKNTLPETRIIQAKPLENLDTIPLPDYTGYFKQLSFFGDNNKPVKSALWYETSRGCWWARKKGCTFCGASLKSIPYRQKSTDLVLEELAQLGKKYQGISVAMSDSIMPLSYKNELLPALGTKKNRAPIHFYYVKANLTLKNLFDFKNAGIERIFPGIEALSNGILRLLKKGTTGLKNIMLLRHARSLDLRVDWSLLWGIPNDKKEYYTETLKLLPLIRHLQAPMIPLRIVIERFSDYWEKPDEYGIKNMKPWNVYNMIYPDWANRDKLAFFFTGEYDSDAFKYHKLIKQLLTEIEIWQKSWSQAKLEMIEVENHYKVYDNRTNGPKKEYILQETQAREIMAYRPYKHTQMQDWAVAHRLGIVMDSYYAPLITAPMDLLVKFDS